MKNWKRFGAFLAVCTMIISYDIKAQDSSIVSTLSAAQNLPAQELPLGSEKVLNKFPQNWTVTNLKDVDSDKFTSLTDSMNAALYDQYHQMVASVSPSSAIYKLLIKKEWLWKQGFKNISDTATWHIIKINTRKSFDLFLTAAFYPLPCNECEYAPTELLFVLFTIKKNKIIDKKLVGYTTGSNLELKDRYFFLNKQLELYIKDFMYDEQSARSLGEQEGRIDEQGFFYEK